MSSAAQWFGVVSYGAAALAHGAVALLLLVSQPTQRRASFAVTAVLASSVWAAGITLLLLRDDAPFATVVWLDAAHLVMWSFYVRSWLTAGTAKRTVGGLSVIAALWAMIAAWPAVVPASSPVRDTVFPALVVTSLICLLAVEQVFRNASEEQSRSLRLLCIAIGGIAVVDLFVYSQAALLDEFVPLFWEARGLANAALLPFLVLGIKRQADWQRELFVSRQVVFYTASLLGVGSYLLMMGLAGYAIRAAGREWGVLLELLFLVVAAAILVAVLFSSGLRARFRALLVKHFYKNKYDYRQEWLQLTQSLGRSGDLGVLAERGLEALARIIGTRRGSLWLTRSHGRYEWMASLGSEGSPPIAEYDSAHPLVTFLAAQLWVIDSEEYAASPDRYQTAFGSPEEAVLPKNSIVVPLDCQGSLQGFVILVKPPQAGALNFEDHDILKTAGKQVAIVLAQSLALEQLTETRQFEVMNKMSTFLMHDLKNIIAQQQLVVANAARFRQRPEFFDDAIATVRAGVERMRSVLEQLQGATAVSNIGGRTDISKALMEVRSHCADREPIPGIACSESSMWVRIDREKLVSVLTHLVRNAQEATPADGTVRLEASTNGREVVCVVSDTGCGMDPVFVRDRLFRPFDSTKGASGMGIGAYQARDMVRAAGGDVEVTTSPGVGTTFRLRLPLADASGTVRAGAVTS